MNKTHLLSGLLVLSSLLMPVQAQVASTKVYHTGKAIEKPLIMSRFIEMQSARSVPEVMFTDTKGEQISLKQYKGKLVLVNLWATWCAPCREEMPMIADFQDRYRDQGLQVIGRDKF